MEDFKGKGFGKCRSIPVCLLPFPEFFPEV